MNPSPSRHMASFFVESYLRRLYLDELDCGAFAVLIESTIEREP